METLTVNNMSVSNPLKSKIELIETPLHQAIYNFRDFVNEVEQLHMTTESVKKQIIAQKEKCERKCCIGSEELKKVIESKDNIIQGVASAITRLNDTKDFNILTEIYRIIFGELTLLDAKVKVEEMSEEIGSDIKIEAVAFSPKKEPNISIQEQNDSVSEIDGTPTGRRSPIIISKKMKSSISTPSREKKKCPQNWITPEKKSTKLTLCYLSPTRGKGSGRMRQQKIQFVREKISTTVDLTTIPQFSKGRSSQAAECLSNRKQDVIENDDTIMPSPTSGPVVPPVYKSLSKESPKKFKKPLTLLRSKTEKTSPKDVKENIILPNDVTNVDEMEESVNLLQEYNYSLTSPKKNKPRNKSPIQTDSISLLQQFNVEEIDAVQNDGITKRPLAENLNAVNTPCDNDSSMSILRRDLKTKTDLLDDNMKRSKCENVEPLYKEPTVRKKAEKRALPGWSCDECKNFYGVLYKDDLEMQAKKMDECSKHRGRNNPIRPKTPPGYWDPRWDVPQDTEEFNRRNNAV